MVFHLPRGTSRMWALEGAVGTDTNNETPEGGLLKPVPSRF